MVLTISNIVLAAADPMPLRAMSSDRNPVFSARACATMEAPRHTQIIIRIDVSSVVAT